MVWSRETELKTFKEEIDKGIETSSKAYAELLGKSIQCRMCERYITKNGFDRHFYNYHYEDYCYYFLIFPWKDEK